jgi:inner membrane protein
MASPVGHGLMGYAVYRLTAGAKRDDRRTLLWLCVLLAIAPDLDFLPGLFLGQPALYHQGVSHSLGFALVVSLGVAVAYSLNRGTIWADWGRFFLAYASHLLIDLFGPDKRPPYGIPLFWPLSDACYLASFQIFRGFHHAKATSSTTGEWVAGILDPQNLVAIGIEVIVTLSVILLVQWVQNLKIFSTKAKALTQRHLLCR